MRITPTITPTTMAIVCDLEEEEPWLLQLEMRTENLLVVAEGKTVQSIGDGGDENCVSTW